MKNNTKGECKMNNRKKYGLIGLIIVVVLIILFVWGFASGVGTDHDSAPERADANATTGDSVQATSSPMDKDKYLNQFLREQEDIMEDMMEEMEEDYNDPEGNASEDYLEGMIPHHEAALDMAKEYLRLSANEELKLLAESIYKTQKEEIQLMERLKDEIDDSGLKDTKKEQDFLTKYGELLSQHKTMQHTASTAQNVEQAFIDGMIPHHQMAIDMSRAILDSADNEEVRRLAENIISTQEDEIKHMQEIRKAAGVASS